MIDPKTTKETAFREDEQAQRDPAPSVDGIPVTDQDAYRVDDMPADVAAEFEAALRTATYGA